MTTTTDKATVAETGALAAIRALAIAPPESLAGMLHAADRQAQLLRNLLPIPINQVPTHLTDLIPSIVVEYIDDLPGHGISFWGNSHWHIHVRASNSSNGRAFIVLHELKHIIDHPLRRQAPVFSDSEWEDLANHFATQALIRQPDMIAVAERRHVHE